jgi:hypothetical protein
MAASGEPNQEQVDPTVGMTEAERAALKTVMGRLEIQLLQRVLSQLKLVAGIVGTVLTVFGLVSIQGMKSTIAEVAANQLASDSRVRDDLITQATQRLARVNSVITRAEQLDERIQQMQDAGVAALDSDLKQMMTMLEQVRADVQQANERRRGAPRP